MNEHESKILNVIEEALSNVSNELNQRVKRRELDISEDSYYDYPMMKDGIDGVYAYPHQIGTRDILECYNEDRMSKGLSKVEKLY